MALNSMEKARRGGRSEIRNEQAAQMMEPCCHVHRSSNLLSWDFHPKRSQIILLMVIRRDLPLFIPLPGNSAQINSFTHASWPIQVSLLYGNTYTPCISIPILYISHRVAVRSFMTDQLG